MTQITSDSSLGRGEDSDYIDGWDDYWLSMAGTAARKSKDPKCRVGAVIVRENVLIAAGFNGFARQVFDDPGLLADPDEKLKWICHAEQNAILNAARTGVALEGATIYVTKFPCLACCNAIVQAGVARIYTDDNKFWDDDPADKDHSRKKSILRQAKIEVDAPFHPEYAPKRVTKKQPSAPAAAGPLPLPGLEEEVATKKKAKKATAARGKSMSLFPARQPIRGGKVDG